MSGAKRMLEDQEAKEAWALGILVDQGTLQECEFHSGTYFDGDGDLVNAYKAGNTSITSGIAPYDASERVEASATIKSVYEDNSGAESCASCDKIMDD